MMNIDAILGSTWLIRWDTAYFLLTLQIEQIIDRSWTIMFSVNVRTERGVGGLLKIQTLFWFRKQYEN